MWLRNRQRVVFLQKIEVALLSWIHNLIKPRSYTWLVEVCSLHRLQNKPSIKIIIPHDPVIREIDHAPSRQSLPCGCRDDSSHSLSMFLALTRTMRGRASFEKISVASWLLYPQAAQAQYVSLIINTCSFMLRNLKWP